MYIILTEPNIHYLWNNFHIKGVLVKYNIKMLDSYKQNPNIWVLSRAIYVQMVFYILYKY